MRRGGVGECTYLLQTPRADEMPDPSRGQFCHPCPDTADEPANPYSLACYMKVTLVRAQCCLPFLAAFLCRIFLQSPHLSPALHLAQQVGSLAQQHCQTIPCSTLSSDALSGGRQPDHTMLHQTGGSGDACHAGCPTCCWPDDWALGKPGQ